jgi:hypothetical protein
VPTLIDAIAMLRCVTLSVSNVSAPRRRSLLGPDAAVATNPASAAIIRRPCTSRSVRPCLSLHPSPNRFQAPVTVFTPNSPTIPEPTIACAVRFDPAFAGVL